MQVGQAKFGMQTMNQSLMSLYSRKLITLEEALGRSQEPDELRQMLVNAGALQHRRARREDNVSHAYFRLYRKEPRRRGEKGRAGGGEFGGGHQPR